MSLLLGPWARLGAAVAIPVTIGAAYAHLVIDVWPNGIDTNPRWAGPAPSCVPLPTSHREASDDGASTGEPRRGREPIRLHRAVPGAGGGVAARRRNLDRPEDAWSTTLPA